MGGMPALELPGEDWNGQVVERSPVQRALANSRYKRVVGEVAEIREAAELMTHSGDPFHQATSVFLTVQARLLDNENESCLGTELPWHNDTAETSGMLPSAARSALLIARAYLTEHRASSGGPQA